MYRDIVRWARAIRANGHHTFVSFDHEPNTKGRVVLGSAADFIAAWRKVVSVFRANSVRNVEWVWTVTAFSFHLPTSDRRAAVHWYPGDDWVDDVGPDGFNWYGCGPSSDDVPTWRRLRDVMQGGLEFARRHSKHVVLPEFGTTVDPQDPTRKPAWIRDAHRWLVANAADFRAVFYFNVRSSSGTCQMLISGRREITAFHALAQDPAFRHPSSAA